MYILFLLLLISVILIGINKIKSRGKGTAPGKKILYLESEKLSDNKVFSKEIEKIKCKEIIKK